MTTVDLDIKLLFLKCNCLFQWQLLIGISNCNFKIQLSIQWQPLIVISNCCFKMQPSFLITAVDHRFLKSIIDHRFLKSISTIAFCNQHRQSLFEIEIDNRFLKSKSTIAFWNWFATHVAQRYQFHIILYRWPRSINLHADYNANLDQHGAATNYCLPF